MKRRTFQSASRLLLALIMAAGALLVPRAQAAEDTIASAVEQQVRAFADSVSCSGADDNAAWELAMHGMAENGKTLHAGKSHPLTATLLGSNLMRTALIDGCTAAIELMQDFGLEELLYTQGSCDWYGAKSGYKLKAFFAPEREYSQQFGTIAEAEAYGGERTAYDSSLDWMAAGVEWDIAVKRLETTEEEIVYEVTSTARDRFDFDTSKGSGFKKFFSFVGMLLFREFDWISSVTFRLTVPNSCTHAVSNYHWSYDAENCVLIPDGSDEFTENRTKKFSCTMYDVVSYYHELEQPVRLSHDRPWVLEYDIRSNFSFALSPVEMENTALPFLWHNARSHLFVRNREYFMSGKEALRLVDHDYGIGFKGKFGFSAQHLYTFHLENEVEKSGGNTLYLTVYDHDLGKTVLPRTAMNEHYVSVQGEDYYVPQNEPSSWPGGRDFVINYIGNRYKRLNAEYFDLRIWENGGEVDRPGTSEVVLPTCTEEGYTIHTCTFCGLRRKISVEDPSHTYDDRQDTVCNVCGEEREAVTLAGDLDGNGRVNARDINGFRREFGKSGAEIGNIAADMNGDGNVNARDINVLRRNFGKSAVNDCTVVWQG